LKVTIELNPFWGGMPIGRKYNRAGLTFAGGLIQISEWVPERQVRYRQPILQTAYCTAMVVSPRT